MAAGTLEKLAEQIGAALQELNTLLQPGNVIGYFEQLGTRFPESLVEDATFSANLAQAGGTAGSFGAILGAFADAEEDADVATIVAEGANLISGISELFENLEVVRNRLDALASNLEPLSEQEVRDFVDGLPRRIVDDAIIRRMEKRRPEFASIGVLLGLVDRFEGSIVGAGSDENFTASPRRLQLSRIGDAFGSSDDYFEGLIGWGASSSDFPLKAIRRIQSFLNIFTTNSSIDSSGSRPVLETTLTTIAANTSSSPFGLDLTLHFDTPDGISLSEPAGGGYVLTANSNGTLPRGTVLTATPPAGLLVSGQGLGDFSFDAGLSLSPDDPIIIGQTGGSRLEVGGVEMSFGMQLVASGSEASGDATARLSLPDGKAVIDFSEGDGFLTSLISGSRAEADFEVAATFSPANGLVFEAGGALEILLPLHASFGPLDINGLKIGLPIGASGRPGLPVDFSTNLGVGFGPFDAVIDGIGLKTDLTFDGGNLGFGNVALGIKLPTGIGLSLDTAGIRGGGFLSIDRDAGRYFGAVELSVFGIGVQAFGLIETRLPSGEDGFSFVVVISAEFTPIQLGFGFTLIGVGGMLGVNRSMDAEGLSTAVRTGSLAHLLFPRNVVQDAPAIIHDLATVFPATPGQYIFGPMAKLGWGTPTLITCSIGVVLEFPGPRLAVLGIAQMALPTPDVGLLRLNLAMAGLLDFPAQKMTLDASLYDSKVVGNTVTGDMAYEMGFGNKPKFLMSVGGFNPGFESPPAFPDLRRASISLGINGNPSLTATGYFALTSNTAQAGARLELRAKGAGIKLSGHFGYDVLFVFSPFSFKAGISAGVSVRFKGFKISVTLRGDLSGPSPMRLKGKVCVSVKIWDACLKVNVKFGKDKQEFLPEMDPWAGELNVDPRFQVIGVEAAVTDPRNWSGTAPPGAFTAVALTAASQAERTPIDPLGAATLRQKVAPLNRTLEKFGEYAPVNHDEFQVVDVTVDGESVDFSPVEDDFVPAHFTELSNAERLSGDSYEKMDAGITIAPDLVKVGSAESLAMEYETKLINDAGVTIGGQPNFVLTRRHLLGMLKRSAAALSGTRRTGTQKYMHPTRAKKVRIVDEKYVVADKCSLKQDLTKTGGVPVARTKAILALRKHLRQVPGDKKRLAVVPTYEAVA